MNRTAHDQPSEPAARRRRRSPHLDDVQYLPDEAPQVPLDRMPTPWRARIRSTSEGPIQYRLLGWYTSKRWAQLAHDRALRAERAAAMARRSIRPRLQQQFHHRRPTGHFRAQPPERQHDLAALRVAVLLAGVPILDALRALPSADPYVFLRDASRIVRRMTKRWRAPWELRLEDGLLTLWPHGLQLQITPVFDVRGRASVHRVTVPPAGAVPTRVFFPDLAAQVEAMLTGPRSGAKGVYPMRDRWVAWALIRGQTRYLGTYATVFEATQARIDALRNG